MTHLNKKLLVTLLDLAQSDVPASVTTLARTLQISRRETACALDELGELGLVQAATIRLTFVGLMHASGLRKRANWPSAAA